MRVVLDANTLASGAVAPAGGVLATIIDLWLAGAFTVVLSHHILSELDRALRTRYFTQRLSAADITAYVQLVRTLAVFVTPVKDVHGVATHPEDDVVLATAVSARADVLVTGDAGLQNLERYRDVSILSPRAFVRLLSQA